MAITPTQLQQGLGKDTIAQLSSKVGIPKEDVLSQLVKILPQAIDKLTPDGKIPQGDVLSQGMGLLKGLFK